MGKTARFWELFRSFTLTFIVGISIILTCSVIGGTNGQAEFRQGYTYKICAVDNMCLSSYEKPSREEGLGKVTAEKYANVPEQHWHTKQGFLNSEYGLTQLVSQSNKYNDITYSLLPQESSPSTNFWRITQVPDDAPWYIIQLYTHPTSNETDFTKEHSLGCVQHMGQKLMVQVLPCTYNEFQKWKFGLVSKINLINYAALAALRNEEIVKSPDGILGYKSRSNHPRF